MRRRSNLMVFLGAAVFIVGAAIVYVVVANDDDGTSTTPAGPDTVEVVVAKEALQPGAAGQDLIDQGKVEVQRVPAIDKQPDAVTALSQLSDKLLTLAFAPGEQVRFGGLRAQSLAIDIPDGFDAVAIDLDFVRGGANYISPGDRINVFAGVGIGEVGTTGASNGAATVELPYTTPRVELLLTNVLVLDVNQVVAPLRTQSEPTAAARTGTNTITFLLALQPVDAEKVIFAQTVPNHLLYVSLTKKDAPPAGPTPGEDDTTILNEEPNAAFQRSNQ